MKQWLWLCLVLFVVWQGVMAEEIEYLSVSGIREQSALNLRQHASTQARKIGRIPYDATCVQKLTCNRYGWCQVRYQDQVGWVAATYTKPAVGCVLPASSKSSKQASDKQPKSTDKKSQATEPLLQAQALSKDTIVSVSGLHAKTPFTEQALHEHFPDWTIQVITNEGRRIFAVLDHEVEQLWVMPRAHSPHIGEVHIRGTKIEIPGGIALNTLFAHAYPSANAHGCHLGIGETLGAVVCNAPDKKNMYYVFRDPHTTVLQEIPPPSQLLAWPLREVIWFP